MVDIQTVCCMCGDVGFPDKLFRCNKCRNRFQHLYCSNYYGEFSEPIEQCDWCQSEERNVRHGNSSKKSGAEHDSGTLVTKRSEYSGDHKIKQHDREENSTTSSDQKERTQVGFLLQGLLHAGTSFSRMSCVKRKGVSIGLFRKYFFGFVS